MNLSDIKTPTDIAALHYMPHIEALAKNTALIGLDLSFMDALMVVKICQLACASGLLDELTTEPYAQELGKALSQIISNEQPGLRSLLKMGWIAAKKA